MKKIVLMLIMLSISLFAEIKNEYLTKELVKSNVPIVDIRTPAEWKNTGIIKNSIPIMFFDDKGGYDINDFLKKLNKKVDTKKTFAILCHTGNRTSMLAPFLSQELGYSVINLKGGIDHAIKVSKIATVPYNK